MFALNRVRPSRIFNTSVGPPKICYLGMGRWPNGPGDPRIFQKQLPALADKGYEVVALITGEGSAYTLHGVSIKPMGWQGGLNRRWRYLYDVFCKGISEQADCYFFGNFELIPTAIMLKIFTGARLVYDAMEHYPDMMRVSRKVWKAIRRPAAAAVDAIERVARPFMDLILTADEPTMCRFRNSRLSEIIFNFPSLTVFDSCDISLTKELRTRYARRLVIVYVGGLGLDRGLDVMIEAMAIVNREFPEALLQLIGPWQFPDQRTEFEQLIVSRGLQDVIELHGPVPQEKLGVYLRLARMGLAILETSSKHQKNIATKQFDYMCCGIPVVATNLNPFLEFTGKAQAGLIISNNHPIPLAEAVLRLLRDPQMAATLGSNGRRAIEEGWNWENQAKLLWETFNKMLPLVSQRRVHGRFQIRWSRGSRSLV